MDATTPEPENVPVMWLSVRFPLDAASGKEKSSVRYRYFEYSFYSASERWIGRGDEQLAHPRLDTVWKTHQLKAVKAHVKTWLGSPVPFLVRLLMRRKEGQYPAQPFDLLSTVSGLWMLKTLKIVRSLKSLPIGKK